MGLLGYSGKTLKDIMQEIDKGLKEIGLPDDKKYFSESVFVGHINICRFTHQPSKKFLDKIKELKNIKLGKMTIDKVNLIFYNAVCNPKTRKTIGSYKLI